MDLSIKIPAACLILSLFVLFAEVIYDKIFGNYTFPKWMSVETLLYIFLVSTLSLIVVSYFKFFLTFEFIAQYSIVNVTIKILSAYLVFNLVFFFSCGFLSILSKRLDFEINFVEKIINNSFYKPSLIVSGIGILILFLIKLVCWLFGKISIPSFSVPNLRLPAFGMPTSSVSNNWQPYSGYNTLLVITAIIIAIFLVKFIVVNYVLNDSSEPILWSFGEIVSVFTLVGATYSFYLYIFGDNLGKFHNSFVDYIVFELWSKIGITTIKDIFIIDSIIISLMSYVLGKKIYYSLHGEYAVCPNPDCNKSLRIKEDWRCDYCNNDQDEVESIFKRCGKCKRKLRHVYCEHCNKKLQIKHLLF